MSVFGKSQYGCMQGRFWIRMHATVKFDTDACNQKPCFHGCAQRTFGQRMRARYGANTGCAQPTSRMHATPLIVKEQRGSRTCSCRPSLSPGTFKTILFARFWTVPDTNLWKNEMVYYLNFFELAQDGTNNTLSIYGESMVFWGYHERPRGPHK